MPVGQVDPLPVGPYRLLHRLGEGGMGVVWLALAPDERAVAVKVLREQVSADADARRRLVREVETLRRVRHPQVAEVLDADLAGDRPYLVTRFVPGRTLEERVRDAGPLPAADVARIGRLLGGALQAIHAAGVVHRDVKPANVMLLDGDPVLIDFGIAHVADQSRITVAGLVMGTPGYLSPEVVAGDPVTPATDWWGWGSTLAFAASGRPPFGTGPVEVVLDAVRRGEPDLAGVHPSLAAVLAPALAVEPAWRPGAVALLAALDRPPPAVPPTVRAPVAPPAVPPTVRAPVVAPTVRAPVVAPTVRAPFAPPTVRAPVAPSTVRPPAQLRPVPAPSRPAPASSVVAPAPAPAAVPGAVLGAVLLTATVVSTVAPGLVLLLAIVGSVLARTVDRSTEGLARRRRAAGPRAGDVPVTVLALPWRIVRAAAATLLALVVPVLVAVSVAFVVGAAVLPTSPRPLHPVALAAAAVAGALTAWWGPGGGSLRRGGTSCLRGVRTGRGRTVLLVVLGLVVLAALSVLSRGVPPDLAPFAPPAR